MKRRKRGGIEGYKEGKREAETDERKKKVRNAVKKEGSKKGSFLSNSSPYLQKEREEIKKK